MKLNLRNYILVQILGLFVIVLCAICVYTNIQKDFSVKEYAKDYMDSKSTQIISEVEWAITSSTRFLDVLASYIKSKSEKKYSEMIDNFAQDSDALFFKNLLFSSDQIRSVQIASSDGKLFQLKHYCENNTTKPEKGRVPFNTKYIKRFIVFDESGKKKEHFKYYSNNNEVLFSEETDNVRYNPVEREWFSAAVNRKNSVNVTEAYQTFDRNPVPVITVSSLMSKKSDEKCVIAIDIQTKYFHNIINSLSSIKGGIICIFNSNGDIISHSMSDCGLNKYMDSSTGYSDQVFRLIKEYITKNGKNAFFSMEENNKKYFVNFFPFSLNFEMETGKKWTVIMFTPAEFFDAKSSNSGNIWLIYIIIMLTIVIQIITISRRVSDPIMELTSETEKIHRFDFSSKFSSSSKIEEVKNLNEVIKTMRISLSSFMKYMPQNLVRKLLEKSIFPKIGGETKNISVFFSDIEGFTTISEGLSAQDTAIYLSRYFEEMTKILLEENATIDKYIGDSVMAFWGAPDDDNRMAFHSCRSALLCQYKLKGLNEEWIKEGFPQLNTRIGISLGKVAVGNVGSSDRMNYTVMGDTVNVASRLEGINKIYKTKIAISESIYDSVKNEFLAVPLDFVRVKGKKIPVKIFELIGQFEDKVLAPSQERVAFSAKFSKGFEFYINMNWEAALNVFSQLDEDIETVKMYIGRCQAYIANPPEDDWDKVFVQPT